MPAQHERQQAFAAPSKGITSSQACFCLSC